MDASGGQGLSKSRIEALSDGVFAVAMTLLILDIKPPTASSAGELLKELLALWPKCITYAVSFLMLGIYWVGQHNQFHLIRRTDRVLLWINLVFLLTIAFVPFSTALLSEYISWPIAFTVYGANLIAIGLILFLHWSYATRRHRLIDHDLNPKVIRFARRRILLGPLVFGLAIGIAWFSPAASLLIYIIVPIVYVLPGKVDQHWSTRGAKD